MKGKKIAIAGAYALYNLTSRRLPRLRMLPSDAFGALKAFFDCVWVLTIPRNEDRQKAFQKEFTGLHYSFFPGVDGKTIVENDLRIDLQQAAKNNGRLVRINELACTWSHVRMYEKMVREKLERVMIFEDDAMMSRRNSKWISYCLERLPTEWDIFYLGYRDGELRGLLMELRESLGLRSDSDRVFSRTVGRGLRTAAGHDFTHAYAVSLSGAKKLLSDAYPIRYTADGWLEHKVLSRDLTALISVPKIFYQRVSLGSSIHTR
jgi:glycosyl transferase family 25